MIARDDGADGGGWSDGRGLGSGWSGGWGRAGWSGFWVGRLRSSALTMWRPMAAVRAAAEARVRPARDGMTKAAGEPESWGALRRRLTRGGSTPAALGLGVWAMTMPGGPSEGMVATAPISRPRRRTLMVAVRSVWPMRLGVATCWAPRASVMRTAHWRRTVVPGVGELGEDCGRRGCWRSRSCFRG